ncbi:hypothetical protein HMI54_005032 [Coelomomyces lativittatus]|nr:hypothetical protein HMI54_005032 [Coelomomyces lativittatus]
MYGPGKHTVPLRLASEPPMYFPGLSVPELKDSFMEKDLTHERSMHLEDDDTQLETEHEDEPPYQRLYDSEEEANRLGPMFGYPPSYHVRYHYDPEPLYLMHTIGLNPMDPSDPTVPLIPPPSLITSSSSHSRSLHPASPLSKSTASTSSSPKTLSLRSMLSHFLSFFTSFFHLKTNSNPSSTSSTSESG